MQQWSATQRNVVIASVLAWTLDAFDFFLLVFVLTDIAQTFKVDLPQVSLAILLTLAVRPIGALLFGRAAERYGRRPVLMINILIYSLLELASAFSPNLTTFLILRVIYGVAMGVSGAWRRRWRWKPFPSVRGAWSPGCSRPAIRRVI